MEYLQGLLLDAYPWTLAFHVIFVISWMAGLLYLPRLFVYHRERAAEAPGLDAVFQVMERKLLRGIMNPAMIGAWIFGLMLVFTPGIISWSETWPWVKATMVLGLTHYHHVLANWRKDFAAGQKRRSGRFFRVANEIPAILMIVIVMMVIGRPF
ncbi:MAG: protoporphyrinogen oxidase HemJ [Pikeienuella sp.]